MAHEHKKLHLNLGLVPVRENLWALGPATVKLNLKTRWFMVLHHQHVQACDPNTWYLQKGDMWMQKVVSRDGMGMVKSTLKHPAAVAAQAEDQGGKRTLYTHNSASSVGVTLPVPGPA